MTADHPTADRTTAGSTLARLARSPLADRADELAAAGTPDLLLAESPCHPMINLRVDPTSPAANRIAEQLGAPIDLPPNTVATAGPNSILWLGPTERLIVGPAGGDPGELLTPLTNALGADRGSIVDVSANRTTVRVEGPAARDVLATGCQLDLHPREFAPGTCAQTTVAHTQAILWLTGDQPAFRLLVRGSFARYLADWLVDAAAEHAASTAFGNLS